jgi:hypothetical protein
LPPVQQSCKFHSLDSSGDPKAQEQPVEMSFDGSAGHLELAGNLGVVTPLQQQLHNLLFARSKPD